MKNYFQLKENIFNILTELSPLERRAEREQKQAEMAQIAAEEDRRRRKAREARTDYRRERRRALELGEAYGKKASKTPSKFQEVLTKGKKPTKTLESFDKLTRSQERDLDYRLKPTRSTVGKVRLPATNSEMDRNVKAWQDENRGTTKQRRIRDQIARERKRNNEAVELDELKMPKRDKTGRIKSDKIRSAYRKGAENAYHLGMNQNYSAGVKQRQAAQTQYRAASKKDSEGTRLGKKADRENDAAKMVLSKSSRSFNRMKKRDKQAESVEFIEATRTAFKGADRATADFQRKLKELGMTQEYMKMVRMLKKKGSGFGLFMKEEDRGEEYASRTGLGPSLGFSIEKVNNEKLGVEDVQKRGDTTFKKTLVAMNESVELDEATMPKFNEILRKGKKLGDWNMMSYFLYNGNVWMLKSGRAVNQGPLEDFMKRSQSGLINSLKFESVQEELGLPSHHSDHHVYKSTEHNLRNGGNSTTRKKVHQYATRNNIRMSNDEAEAINAKGKHGDAFREQQRRVQQHLKNRHTTKKESVELDEVSPPGFEGTVKAMKKRHSKEIDNPWALAWYMKNKGYKSHKNKDGSNKKEN